jgi:hypothetical protein
MQNKANDDMRRLPEFPRRRYRAIFGGAAERCHANLHGMLAVGALAQPVRQDLQNKPNAGSSPTKQRTGPLSTAFGGALRPGFFGRTHLLPGSNPARQPVVISKPAKALVVYCWIEDTWKP